MSILKKEYWVVNGILMVITEGIYVFVLAHLMKLYQKDAWYCDYRYWVISALCFVLPIFILLLVFLAQMLTKVAAQLEVPGKELYGLPYTWIICLVIPVVGWTLLIVMWIYLLVWIVVMLARGKGEAIRLEEA